MFGDDDTWLKNFSASLPGSYRNRYGTEEIRLHASIARARGTQPARVGVVPLEGDGLGICVVAKDAPGLFSKAPGPASSMTSRRTRRGWRAAYTMALMPPIE